MTETPTRPQPAAATPPEEADPFEVFNRHQGQGVVIDPYPEWAELRRKSPVHRLSIMEMMGREGPAMPGMSSEVYMPLTFDGVTEVLRDGQTFSSSGYARTMGLVMGHTILEMDEPEHSRYRGLIQRAFTRKSLQRWERELVRPLIRQRVSAIRAAGQGDLIRELTFPFPVAVIAGMIGLPEEEHAAFHRLAVELIMIAYDPPLGMRASQSLKEMFGRLLEKRRAEPTDDLTSVLAHAELDDIRLDDEAIFAFLRLLAPAGAETTYRSSSNLLYGLLHDPEQLEALARDRRLIPQAIEEGLRWECPLTTIMRTTTRDVELEGVAIPSKCTVGVNMGAANRDPARWEEPDRFDILRPQRPHVAFALGPHTCMGMHLARMETRVLLEELLDALPGLRLGDDAEDAPITGLTFRSPGRLLVQFDP